MLNESESIHSVVEAMTAQDLSEVEFLFADGRSSDDTRAILEGLSRDDSRIKVLDNPETTTAAGLNVALGAASGKFVARMDGHTIYPSNYLSTGVARLEKGDVDWVSGPQVPEGSGLWDTAVADALDTRLGTGGSNKWGSRDGAEFDLTYSVFTGVWKRETLLELGGWAEDWPINQDSELAARVIKSGGRIVCVPAMAATYQPRKSPGALARQYRRYGEYRAKTALRHPESLRPDLVLLPGIVLTFVAALAAPFRPLRMLARLGLGAYSLAVSSAVATVWRRTQSPARALRAGSAVLVMHFTWGTGFIRGLLKHGIGGG